MKLKDIIVGILILFSFTACRTLKTTITTKETVKITYRDTTVKVPKDSTTITTEIAKDVTPEEKKVLENLPEQIDTIIQGNFQIIRNLKKGKETLQIKTKPKDLTIKAANKETEKVKETVVEKVYQPSTWEKIKTMLGNWLALIIIAIVLGVTFYIVKKMNKPVP